MELKTPKLKKSRYGTSRWKLEFGWLTIQTCKLSEARRIADRIRWRARTGMVPILDQHCHCQHGKEG